MRVITIGRGNQNDVDINDSHASRHHMQIIQHDDGHFSLSDFGSTNGTYVNGQKISGEITLNDMDIVRIGNTTIPWRMYFEDTDMHESAPQIDNSQTRGLQPDISSTPEKKQRHGFVTFWLWLGVIGGVFSIISAVTSYLKMSKNINDIGRQLEYAGIDVTPYRDAIDALNLHVGVMQVAALFFAICIIVCYVLLLNWKKIGFWIIVGTSVVSVVVSVVMMNLMKQDYAMMGVSILKGTSILQYIVTPISILILWAVLQIKKNGISCWKQLE